MADTASLREYLAAIERSLRAHFGDRIRQYGIYEPWDEDEDEAEPKLKTPALLIQVEGIEPDLAEDHAEGAIGIQLSMCVHALLSLRTPRLQIALPELAAGVITLIAKQEARVLRPPSNGNRWGLEGAVGLPEMIRAEPADFSPGLHGHDGWAVRFEQTLYLPETLPR